MSWAKTLGVMPSAILREVSYNNILLYAAATPDYSATGEKDKKPKWDESLNADNPDNNDNPQDRVRV